VKIEFFSCKTRIADHPVLSSQKRLSSEAFIMKSGMFWPAPDNTFGGCYLDIDLVPVYSEGFGSLDSRLSCFLVVR
jgi:hypothetical protein